MVDAKTKAEREAEARRALLGGKTREQAMAEFIARGNPDAAPEPAPEPATVASAPAPTAVAPLATTEEGGTTPRADDASEPADRLPEGAHDAETPAVAAKPARAPKKAPGATPWADAHPKVSVNFSTKFPEELHMQMIWLTNHVPKLSIQKIVQEGAAAHVAKLLKEHYKP